MTYGASLLAKHRRFLHAMPAHEREADGRKPYLVPRRRLERLLGPLVESWQLGGRIIHRSSRKGHYAKLRLPKRGGAEAPPGILPQRVAFNG
jgi:hypothetical protein